MSAEVDDAERSLLGRDELLSGSIRFASVDTTLFHVMPALADFAEQYPGITLELVSSQEFLSLTRREADVVLRATNTPPDALVGRKLARHAMGIYASHVCVDRMGDAAALEDYPWILWEDEFSQAWMDEHLPNARIVCRVNTAKGMIIEAIRAGIGAGHVLCHDVHGDDDFVRLADPIEELGIDLWLL